MIVQLTDEEHMKLKELYHEAQTTPILVFGPDGRNTADSAWGLVRTYMDELGQKYGYDPKTAKISMDGRSFEAEARP